jgi:glucose-1-phosphatase
MLENKTSKIKNIIFDLGGVLLNINPLLSLLELESISHINKDELLLKLANEKLFEKFDTGSLSPGQFRSGLCKVMNLQVPDSEIDRIWNKLLLDFPSSRVALLQQLKNNYRVFLLSNTNSIHFDDYTRKFSEKYAFPMTDLFDELFLSFEIGLHKPDPGIYTHLLNSAHVIPSECVFFDDSLANVEAAVQQGIAGIHISDHDVTHYFEDGILKKS